MDMFIHHDISCPFTFLFPIDNNQVLRPQYMFFNLTLYETDIIMLTIFPTRKYHYILLKQLHEH